MPEEECISLLKARSLYTSGLFVSHGKSAACVSHRYEALSNNQAGACSIGLADYYPTTATRN